MAVDPAALDPDDLDDLDEAGGSPRVRGTAAERTAMAWSRSLVAEAGCWVVVLRDDLRQASVLTWIGAGGSSLGVACWLVGLLGAGRRERVVGDRPIARLVDLAPVAVGTALVAFGAVIVAFG